MSVRLLIGRSGSGKTTYCLNEIEEQMIKDPDGDPIIYLVPDQMTFLSEYKLATSPHLGGMIRTQVYSFSRLAWRILQETGGISRYHLSSVGISMLIRKIIEDKKEDLKLFEKAADKNGFIGQVEQILTEFKRYCISPEELVEKGQSLNQDNSAEKVLQDKLHDLELIYKAFEESIENKYIDSEDYLRLLAESISSSKYLKHAQVYIDGFYSFTPQEYMIIEQLMKNCEKVTVTFTLDRPFDKVAPDELHLFRMSGETCQTIYEIASVQGIPVEEVRFQEQMRMSHDSLRHLEANFDSRPAVPFDRVPTVHLAAASNRRAEMEGIARTVRKLVREEDYRYRDIALLVRNGHDYHDLIETIFHDYEIPFFIDQKRSMLHHPLVEFIRSALEIINGYWRYEPVFRAVKTELLFPLDANHLKVREQMDRLENYVLAYGIQGQKWTKKDRWRYRRFRGLELDNIVQTDVEKKIEDELNELKDMISASLLKLTKRLKKADNGRKLCEALYLFLEEQDIPAKLEKWKLEEEDKGNLVRAREHDQAWNAIMELLDQFVEILGDEAISIKQFSSILDAGMESLRFSLVPPAVDQVLVADLEKSRLSEIKIAFVIGLNEGVLPAKFSEEGLLADEDRENLLKSGLRVSPSSKTRLLDEEFLAYKAFTTPARELFLSYPLANEEGKALVPSSYIKRMGDFFPNLRQHDYLIEPSELTERDQLDYVEHDLQTLSYLTAQLQLKKRNYPMFDIWWDVYNFYLHHSERKEKAMKVLSSLSYQNESVSLTKETSRELYGEEIQASVSRMEMFHSCPFSHFAQHGLKLRERQIFRLEAPDIGELFHSALKYIVETIMVKNLDWNDMTRKEIELLAKEAVDLLAPKLQNEILLSSNRHHYIKRKLEQIIRRASLVISEHAKASGFAPVGLELGFGPKQQLPPMKFTLKNGTRMELVGRIDRVDKAEDDHGVYLRVIDYKSSSKDLNLSELYYGLALQMLTYLDIIMTNSVSLLGKTADSAGVLYFHVHNPMVNAKRMLTLDELEGKLLKKFKMTGLLLDDQNIIKLMDQSLESGDSSIISAGIKKDGTLSKKSKVATKAEFKGLMSYVRNMYVQTGNSITEGTVQISPYKMKDRKPCTFCSFKDVCQFDESLAANKFRELPSLSKEKALELIMKEGNGNHENSSEA